MCQFSPENSKQAIPVWEVGGRIIDRKVMAIKEERIQS